MFSKVSSVGLQGFSAQLVEVEADLSSGLPRFDLVGLPGSSVNEARERVRSAIKNAGLTFPISRITVNLAPAEYRKEGSFYDLPILLAILLASGQLKADLRDAVVLGELSLDGKLRPIQGLLPMLLAAQECGIARAFIPRANRAEASVVNGMIIYDFEDISSLLKHLTGEELQFPIPPLSYEAGDLLNCGQSTSFEGVDFADIRGQELARRGMEIAAAGGHNILLTGSPGSGKSMLARALPSILPTMTYAEALETTKIYSVAGLLPSGQALITERPFRSPHHSATAVSLSGGGNRSKPGEISLANHGVLFLDELPLFHRYTLESLRQPLEDRSITITRNRISATYPCNIMLVCAMNPCPCGYRGDPGHSCTCTPQQVKLYQSRVSGPLLDRIDLQIAVSPVKWTELMGKQAEQKAESSAVIRARVEQARHRQRMRFQDTGISSNACIPAGQISAYCSLSEPAEKQLKQAFEALHLSARAKDKILRVARTVADLDDSEDILAEHLGQALQFRALSFQN